MTSRSTLAAALLAAFAALAVPAGAPLAAGLGRLTVQSALGQPLRAEVEVTSLSNDELQSLGARLASPEAFQQAGLQYNAALFGLRLSVQPRGGRTFISITSNQAINEPFVDLLIELSWAGGKLLREYTFLLDPPSAPPPQAPMAQAPAIPPAAATQTSNPQASTRATAEAPAARQPSAAQAASQTAGGAPDGSRSAGTSDQVNVRRGDTLSAIAGKVKPAEVNLDQAMMAIYRANPAAFAGNMNLLRAGASLAIPEASSMASLGPDEARNQVRLQSADFSRYRKQLAGSAPAVSAAPGASAASGSVAGRVQDGAGPAQGADRLRLSRPELAQGPGAGQGGAVGRSGAQPGAQASAAEQVVARDAALRESQSRIEALEKNVDDLKKLLELRSRAMSDLQGQLDEARAAAKASSGAVVAPPSAGATPAMSATPAPPAAPAAAQPAAVTPPPAPIGSTNTEPAAAASPPAADASTGTAPSDASSADVTPKSEPAPVAAATQEPAPVAPKPTAAAPASPVAQPDFFDELLDNPLLLPALGGIAALGGGYALYAIRRRRRVERFEDSLIAADALAPNSLFGSTGGQSVDTRQVDLPVDGPATQIQATEVDPIEEANVYVAYGREAQAEDILREGMKRNPERHAIRQRLLELYAARADRPAFEALARELQSMTAGEGVDWERAAALGRSVDPDNALYAAADTALGNASRMEPSQDLDFRIDAPPDSPAEAQTSRALAEQSEPGSPEVPVLDLAFDFPSDVAASAQQPSELSAASELPSEGLRSRIPDLPDTLDLDLDLAALEAISRIETPAQASRTGAPLADLGLDLDLDGDKGLSGIPTEPAAADSPRWQEMATKLDLASAYDEIGDREGARELLQEVIAGGDAQQQAKARDMLAKLV